MIIGTHHRNLIMSAAKGARITGRVRCSAPLRSALCAPWRTRRHVGAPLGSLTKCLTRHCPRKKKKKSYQKIKYLHLIHHHSPSAPQIKLLTSSLLSTFFKLACTHCVSGERHRAINTRISRSSGAVKQLHLFTRDEPCLCGYYTKLL